MVENEHEKTAKETTEKKKNAKRGPSKRIEGLAKELEDCREKVNEWEDKFLRLAADYDNYKKRSVRDFGELIQNANEELIGQLIPVVDNFERALAAAQSSDDFSSFHQGVELIYQQLRNLLEKQGVKEIQALNEPFDPNVHEAVMVIESEDAPPETVVELVEKGYMLYDKVLRPSKVAVSK
jgi:molecular chaperone GrpE